MSKFRRQIMMSAAMPAPIPPEPPQPFVIPYITDGLVLYLDGIEKGDTVDAWTDLINDVVFTKKASGVTFNTDNVQFGSSTNNALHNTTTTNITTSTAGTIELCYRDIPTSGTHTAFYSYGTGGTSICFQFISGTSVVINVGNGGSRPYNGVWTAETTGTYSISASRAIQNFTSKGFQSTRSYITRKMVASVVGGSGRGESSAYDTLAGKIHSLRIYSRQLTEEEVLFNQGIDNTRFNLGLTVNE